MDVCPSCGRRTCILVNPACQRIADLERQLAEEKKLSEAIIRDCSIVALERNVLRDQLAQKEAEIARMKPVVERLVYSASYIESALEDADPGAKGVSHVAGLLKDIQRTLKEYEQSTTTSKKEGG